MINITLKKNSKTYTLPLNAAELDEIKNWLCHNKWLIFDEK